MEPLLFLAHRIPYPPNKGDKIRSYHLLQSLIQRYAVHLGAFVDDPADWPHEIALNSRCASVNLLPLDTRRAKLLSLRGLLSGKPLTLPYYAHPAMQRWVDTTLQRHAIRRIVVFSSSMAQYVTHHTGTFRLMDFVDLDSDKWRQYASTKPWPLRWLYRREGTLLFDYECQIARQFDASFLVSQHEAEPLRQALPEHASKIGWYHNGVDTQYFDPSLDFPCPYPKNQIHLVFTGAMDYWPNVDAMNWFANSTFPSLRQRHPNLQLWIVGSNPGRSIQQLATLPGIHVTGRVADIRPYLAHAHVALAPLRIARGIQNKVLEALAMNLPVMLSPAALEGLSHDILDSAGCLLASTPEDWNQLSGTWLTPNPSRFSLHRHWVRQHFDWETNLSVLDSVMRPHSPSP
ncbi:MAG: TIGR03087 family PEP-CTERM/XrtA system glycosyltransferase [Betaproteobacteria bacterium]|nr:TIGR03087 family PEP-CTERM/XrtA system glycosyltransferase [Betaproteobacteria bacterium]